MMRRKKVLSLLISILLTSIPVATPAIADSNNSNKNSSKSQATTLMNEWILPASKKSPIIVQAGRTLPIKFKLVENGAALQSTNLVTLSYVKLNGCQTNSIPELNVSPIVVIAPTTVSPAVTSSPTTSPTSSPTATASPAATASSSPTSSPTTVASPSPSEVEKRSVLQIEKGTFVFNWKVPKTLNDGCYRLSAQKGTSLSIQSPVLRVKSGR
jgi:hypothetical protein